MMEAGKTVRVAGVVEGWVAERDTALDPEAILGLAVGGNCLAIVADVNTGRDVQNCCTPSCL